MPSLSVTISGSGPRLVLCHGFTQDGTLWGPFGQSLAEVATLYALDLPGHGGSAEIALDLEGAADAIVVQMGEEPFDLLGYSLGGRTALMAALRHPEAIRRLVLIGATAGIADEHVRAARQVRDEETAAGLVADGDVHAFIERWLAQPMFARLDPERAGLERRAANSATGLATSLRLMGTGAMRPLWGELSSIATPTLLLAGANDPRFAMAAQDMAAAMANAVFSLVVGAGHACHLEQPALCARLVRSWLAQTDPHPNVTPSARSAPTAS